MQTLDLADLSKLTVDEKQRALYAAHSNEVQRQGQELIESIKDEETCNIAAGWIRKQRDFVDSINKGYLGTIKDIISSKLKAVRDEMKGYTDPCEAMITRVQKDGIDRWLRAETEKRRLEQERIANKMREEAKARAIAEAARLKAEGNLKEAKQVLKQPLEVYTPVIAMPKIKGVVMVEKYVCTVKDPLKFLRFVLEGGDSAAIHAIKFDTTALETMAEQRAGKLGFPGIEVQLTSDGQTRRRHA